MLADFSNLATVGSVVGAVLLIVAAVDGLLAPVQKERQVQQLLGSLISWQLPWRALARLHSVTELAVGLLVLLASTSLLQVVDERVLIGQMALYTTYTLVQAAVLIRGVNVECGCFQSFPSSVSGLTTARSGIVAGLTLLAFATGTFSLVGDLGETLILVMMCSSFVLISLALPVAYTPRTDWRSL